MPAANAPAWAAGRNLPRYAASDDVDRNTFGVAIDSGAMKFLRRIAYTDASNTNRLPTSPLYPASYELVIVGWSRGMSLTVLPAETNQPLPRSSERSTVATSVLFGAGSCERSTPWALSNCTTAGHNSVPSIGSCCPGANGDDMQRPPQLRGNVKPSFGTPTPRIV